MNCIEWQRFECALWTQYVTARRINHKIIILTNARTTTPPANTTVEISIGLIEFEEAEMNANNIIAIAKETPTISRNKILFKDISNSKLRQKTMVGRLDYSWSQIYIRNME